MGIGSSQFKKKLKLSLIGFFCLFSFALILELASQYFFPKQLVQSIAETQLSKSFRREVKVESISGSPFSGIIAKNVRIASFDTLENGRLFDIDQMNIRINWKKLIKTRDFIASIDELNCKNTVLNFIRTKDDKWNLIDFVSPPADAASSPLVFTGDMIFEKIDAYFLDQKGWQKKPSIFKKTFQLKAKLSFKNPSLANMDISGILTENKSTVKFFGPFNAITGAYKFNFEIDQLPVSTWSDYSIPIEGYTLKKSTAKVNGYLKSRNGIKGIDNFPFEYFLSIRTSKSQFKLPFFSTAIADIESHFELDNQLGHRLTIIEATGSLNTIPLKAKGVLDIQNTAIDMAFDTQSFETHLLQKLLNPLKNIQYAGKGQLKMRLSGPLESPLLKGELEAQNLNLFKIPLQDIQAGFTIKAQGYSFKIYQAFFQKSPIVGSGDFNISLKNSFQTEFSLKEFSLPLSNEKISPTFKIVVPSAGEAIQLQMSQFEALNQSFESLKLNLKSLQKQSPFQVLSFSGSINQQAFACKQNPNYFFYCDSRLQLRNPLIKRAKTASYQFKTQFEFPSDQKKRPSFIENLAVSLSLKKLETSKTEYPFSVTLEKNHQTLATYFETKQKDQVLLYTSKLNTQNVLQQTLSFQQFPIKKLNLLQNLIPGYLLPFEGILNADLSSKLTKNNWDKFHLNGQFKLKDALVKNQFIETIQGNINFEKNTLKLSKVLIKKQSSQIQLDAEGPLDKIKIQVHEGSYLEAKDFSVFLKPFSISDGVLGLHGVFTSDGSESRFRVLGRNILYKNIKLHQVQGTLETNQNSFAALPLEIWLSAKEKITFSGRGFWTELFNQNSNKKHQLLAQFEKVELASLLKIQQSIRKIAPNASDSKLKLSPPPLHTNWLYHHTQKNDLNLFFDWLKDSYQNEKEPELSLPVKGSITGRLILDGNSINAQNLYGDLTISAFKWRTHHIQSIYWQHSLKSQEASLKANEIRYPKGFIQQIHLKAHIQDSILKSTYSSFLKNNKKIENWLSLHWRLSKKTPASSNSMQLSIHPEMLPVLTSFSNNIDSISNQGTISIKVGGELEAIQIESFKADLNQFEIKIKELFQIENVHFKVAQQSLEGKNNHIQVSQLPIQVRFKENEPGFEIKSDVDINFTQLQLQPVIRVTPRFNLMFSSTKITLSEQKYFNGTLTNSLVKYQSSIAGPKLFANLNLEDSLITIPPLSQTKSTELPSFNLNLGVGQNVSLQGSFLGEGIFNQLGSNASITFAETDKPLQLKYENNRFYCPEPIYIKEGYLSLLDREFKLIEPYQQEALFLNRKEYISRNQFKFKNNSPELINLLNITAVAVEDTLDSETGLMNEYYPYQATVISARPINKTHQHQFIISSYLLDQQVIAQSKSILQDEVDFSTETSEENKMRAYKVLLPPILNNKSQDSLSHIGEHQSNFWLRQNIRPLENSIAQQVGSKDFKIDFNLGQSLFRSQSSGNFTQFLGLQSLWELGSNRTFLFTRIETPLISESHEVLEKFKITNASLSYRLTQSILVQIKSITDYQDTLFLNPKLAIKYRYEF